MRWCLWLLLVLLGVGQSARILGINPTPSYSHQVPLLIIMRSLAERGHDVTLITTDPIKDPPARLKQINVSSSYTLWKSEINFFNVSKTDFMEAMKFISKLAEKTCEVQLESAEMKQFLVQKNKFDVVIIETFLHFCYCGMLHDLGYPPVVGFLSLGLTSSGHTAVGNPLNPAYIPEFTTSYTHHMSFWERLSNAYRMARSWYSFHSLILPAQERSLRKFFGDQPHSAYEALHNLSLMLVTNHFSVSYPIPNQPTVIELTGLHIRKKRDPLPKDIQKFLDGASDGVIYFSLGSNMRSENLPEATRRALLEAFSELPQRVLWKWEADSLPGQPDNVMVAKWLPQQDVLAHPNIRLFITQGGLQSLNEAAYFGVPLLGIPFFGDQGFNIAKVVLSGIGERVEFSDITKNSLLNSLRNVLSNKSYRENMRRFSAVYREHQEESLDKAVWWIEYVIRHNGARHLRSAALDLYWWQLLLLDVAAFLLAVVAAVGLALYFIIRKVVNILWTGKKSKSD